MAASYHEGAVDLIQVTHELHVHQFPSLVPFCVLRDMDNPIRFYKGSDHTCTAI